jgi:hypothetical protein
MLLIQRENCKRSLEVVLAVSLGTRVVIKNRKQELSITIKIYYCRRLT